MRLCMMPVSIFVSRLGIIDLVNEIKAKYAIIFGNINKYI